MKILKDILRNVEILETIGSVNFNIASITFDSRNIIQDCLFIALKGTKTDGHNFIGDVIQRGAIAIICEIIPSEKVKGITYVKVSDSNAALGFIASNYYENPSSKLKLVGITGTNGKTTVATLLFNLFRKAGFKTGLLSTVTYKINDTDVNATHTTPDAIQLNSLLSRMVEEGCTHCFMEVSSHAVVQKRIAGLYFAGGVFTNITHDHLDYHKTFDEYLKAKKTFFDNLPKEAFALSNIDDKNGNVILQNTKALKKTYSLQKMSDFKAKLIQNEFSGIQLNLDGSDIWCKLVGNFNAYNLLAIYATAILLEADGNERKEDWKEKVLMILSDLNPVEGRFDYFRNKDNIVSIVDYAHTPDALLNVLKTINEIQHSSVSIKNTKLITVVGCGGDRDKTKRPVMAGIACEYSDRVILTSDNPRSEDPEQIISEMQSGIDEKFKNKVVSIVNRREAIKTASLFAKPGDIVLVAGKGHETYQEIKGVRFPFDDKKELIEIMNNK